MNNADAEYLRLCEDILHNGTLRNDRTGTGTLSVFGRMLRFDLSEGFPILTTKKIPFRIVAEELLFFLRGDTELKSLLDVNVDIWTRDAYKMYLRDSERLGFDPDITSLDQFRNDVMREGFDLGPIYGANWRNWGEYGIDQLRNVIEEIKRNPDSRRLVMTTWNPDIVDDGVLPPCHGLTIQFYVENGKLSCHMYQRSADSFLGLPWNIASYALLTEIIAAICDLDVGELVISIGDAHIYTNHIEQVKEQLTREPRPLPKLNLIIPRSNDVDALGIDDFYLSGYDPHPTIKGEQSF